MQQSKTSQKTNKKTKRQLPDPYTCIKRGEDAFIADSLRSVYYTYQGLFLQNKMVCEKTIDREGIPLFFDQRGPVVNKDVLIQTLLYEGFVYEYTGEFQSKGDEKSFFISFTDRSLTDIPREVAAVIRGPYLDLVTAVEEFKATVAKTVDMSNMDVDKMPKTHDINSIYDSLVCFCSIRIFFHVTEYDRYQNHFVLKNYIFTTEKELGTSFATKPPQNHIDKALAFF